MLYSSSWKSVSSFPSIPTRLILMNQLRVAAIKIERPLSAVTRESEWSRARKGPREQVVKGERKKEREKERGHSRNKIERNGGGMEWNSIGMARDAVSSHWTAESDASRGRDRGAWFLSRRGGVQLSRRVISRIFSILSPQKQRTTLRKRKLDTYVQVRPSRFLSRRRFLRFRMPTMRVAHDPLKISPLETETGMFSRDDMYLCTLKRARVTGEDK